MTDIDLDAANPPWISEAITAAGAAVDAYVGSSDAKPPAALIIALSVRAAAPVLLARLAEVEAERDEALRSSAEARDDALTVAMSHNSAMRAVMAERDSYRDAIKRYDAVHDNLAAENARLRQDLAAANGDRDAHVRAVREGRNYWMGRLLETRRDLAAANDALADVTGKLDKAREERNRARGRLEQLEKDVVCAHKRCPGCWHCRGEYWVDDRDEAAALADRDAMRPVVEAAEAWRDDKFGSLVPMPAPWYCGPQTEIPLVAAVDAYRAARPGETPGALVPGEDDITAEPDAYRAGQKAPETAPQPRQSQDQGKVEGPSTNTAQAQRGAQGDGGPVEYYFGGFREWRADGTAEPVTADPPGLDAAIEAARRVAQRGAYVSPRWVEEAVRAAAPALRAGALREAADEIEHARGVYERVKEVGPTAKAVIEFLCERADRIGGAT